MIPYSQEHVPPAPVLQVAVAHVVHPRRRQLVAALLDTGSDITAIPDRLVAELQLYPVGRLQLEDLRVGTTRVLTYAVHLTVVDSTLPQVEVVLTGLDFIVLGRDVLNQFYAQLAGPEQRFALGLTPFA